MSNPLHRSTLFGVTIVALILLFAFPWWPLLVTAFEAGLLVGVFLHSSHSSRFLPEDTEIITDGGEDQKT